LSSGDVGCGGVCCAPAPETLCTNCLFRLLPSICSLAKSVRQKVEINSHAGPAAAMTARDALTAAVKGGARNLGRDDIGEIAPGFAADFVGFRTDSIAFAGAQRDVVCALIFCSPGADQVLLLRRAGIRVQCCSSCCCDCACVGRPAADIRHVDV
jgi:Amidohydrolase family